MVDSFVFYLYFLLITPACLAAPDVFLFVLMFSQLRFLHLLLTIFEIWKLPCYVLFLEPKLCPEDYYCCTTVLVLWLPVSLVCDTSPACCMVTKKKNVLRLIPPSLPPPLSLRCPWVLPLCSDRWSERAACAASGRNARGTRTGGGSGSADPPPCGGGPGSKAGRGGDPQASAASAALIAGMGTTAAVPGGGLVASGYRGAGAGAAPSQATPSAPAALYSGGTRAAVVCFAGDISWGFPHRRRRVPQRRANDGRGGQVSSWGRRG